MKYLIQEGQQIGKNSTLKWKVSIIILAIMLGSFITDFIDSTIIQGVLFVLVVLLSFSWWNSCEAEKAYFFSEKGIINNKGKIKSWEEFSRATIDSNGKVSIIGGDNLEFRLINGLDSLQLLRLLNDKIKNANE
jgi:hypothetical protein